MVKANKTNVDLTWRTIPGNKAGIKIDIPAGVSKINKRPFEELPDSDSSSESLPENVLANYKSNVLSSDNDTDIEHNETGKSLLDESEDASVKSEPLSEDEEYNRNDSMDKSYAQKEVNKSTKKDKRKSSDSLNKNTPLIKPCTTEEYNEFLRIERSLNESSLKLGTTGNENSSDEEMHNNHSKTKKNKSPEKEIKKKKKKKKSTSDSEDHSKKINNSGRNNCSQESDGEEFETPANSKSKNKNSCVNSTSNNTINILEYNDETPKLKKKKKKKSAAKKSVKKKAADSDDEIIDTTIITKKKKLHSQTLDMDVSQISDKLERTNSSKISKLNNLNNNNDSSDSETTYVDRKSKKHKTSISDCNDNEKVTESKDLKKKRKSLNKSVEFADEVEKNSNNRYSFNNSVINDDEIPKKEKRLSKLDNSVTDYQQKILDLNNTNNSTDSEESSANELDVTSHSFTYKSNQKEVKGQKNLNLSKNQDDESSESEDEVTDIKQRYSFQFNRSYDSPNKSKTDIGNKSADSIKLSTNKNEMAPNLGSKKMKKSVHSIKNFANSTALDVSNLELPDMSIGNVSNIKDIEKTIKNIEPKSHVYDLTLSPTKGKDENKILNNYLAKNENLQLKNFVSNLGFDKLGDDDEVFFVQCPKNIDPNLLVDQNIFDSSFQYNGSDYKFSTIKNQNVENISLFVPTQNSGEVKTLPLAGHVIIQTDLKPVHVKKVKKTKHTIVEFPENLKVRHPIFGKSYKKKINIPEHIQQELKSKKTKKSKKHKKHSKSNLQDDSDITESVQMSTKKRKRHSVTEEYEIPKKKKKKEIKQEDELWASNDDIARNLFN